VQFQDHQTRRKKYRKMINILTFTPPKSTPRNAVKCGEDEEEEK
jgi:hypothetical protein